jgi:serine/threonine-protein kinase
MDNGLQQSIGEVTAAVVYDPDRSCRAKHVADKTTVLEHSQQQSPASRPVAAPGMTLPNP